MSMKNDIFFIAATHGNEQLGVDVLQELSQKESGFDWIIGNQEAFRRGQRFYQKDLNRCGKGDIRSTIYEQRRAAQIQELVKKYRYTIDLHGTLSPCGIFSIVANPTKENIALAAMLDVKRLVIWPSITPEMQSPISEFFPCGIEIECGKKEEQATRDSLYAILSNFLSRVSDTKELNDRELEQALSQKDIYLMIGNIKKTEVPSTVVLEEFSEVSINGETYTPVFVGTYAYSDVIGYKLIRLTVEDIYHRYLRE